LANLSTNNIGTFGQYSVGVSGQIKDTVWLGFVRVDYRDGSEIHGLSGTGYLRQAGIPTYGHSGLAGDVDDVRAHGRDERVAVKSFFEGGEYLYRLVKRLSGAN